MSISAVFLVVFSIAATAQLSFEVASPGPRREITLAKPLCIDTGAEIKEIKDTIAANAKTEFKYKGYAQALKSDSDVELLARLAYSETMAANCPQQNNEIAPYIVAAINNRIQKRNGDVRSVVFQRDQFASSLNIYDESRFLDFLCPKDLGLWNATLKYARAALNKSATTKLSASTINYFLYKHSPKWPKEPSSWKLKEDLAAPEEIRSCVRFFQNPSFK